jgi:hypothetical protein
MYRVEPSNSVLAIWLLEERKVEGVERREGGGHVHHFKVVEGVYVYNNHPGSTQTPCQSCALLPLQTLGHRLLVIGPAATVLKPNHREYY